MKYRREPIDPPDSLVPSDEDESSIYTAADLTAAEERGRREVMKVLEGVRWHFDHDFTSDADTYVCGGCRREKSDPENHAPYCEVGKLYALLGAKEAGDE